MFAPLVEFITFRGSKRACSSLQASLAVTDAAPTVTGVPARTVSRHGGLAAAGALHSLVLLNAAAVQVAAGNP